MVAKASRVLEHAVEPDGDFVVQGVIDSGAKPAVAEHASLNRELLRRFRFCNLGYAVNDAAGAAAAEDHPVRTLQGFDTFEVVQIAIVLNIVTCAIDKEIRR